MDFHKAGFEAGVCPKVELNWETRDLAAPGFIPPDLDFLREDSSEAVDLEVSTFD